MEGHGPGYAVENQMNQGYRQILSLISGGASLPRLTGLGSEDKPGGKDSVSLAVLKENEIQGALRLFCRIGMVAQFRQTTYDLASAGWRDLCSMLCIQSTPRLVQAPEILPLHRTWGPKEMKSFRHHHFPSTSRLIETFPSVQRARAELTKF